MPLRNKGAVGCVWILALNFEQKAPIRFEKFGSILQLLLVSFFRRFSALQQKDICPLAYQLERMHCNRIENV